MRLAHFLRRRRRRRRRRAVPAGDVRTPQNLGLSQNRATGTLNENPNAVHHLISILIRTIHQMILKYPRSGCLYFEGPLYFSNNQFLAEKSYEEAVRAKVTEQYLSSITWQVFKIGRPNPTGIY